MYLVLTAVPFPTWESEAAWGIQPGAPNLWNGWPVGYQLLSTLVSSSRQATRPTPTVRPKNTVELGLPATLQGQAGGMGEHRAALSVAMRGSDTRAQGTMRAPHPHPRPLHCHQGLFQPAPRRSPFPSDRVSSGVHTPLTAVFGDKHRQPSLCQNAQGFKAQAPP